MKKKEPKIVYRFAKRGTPVDLKPITWKQYNNALLAYARALSSSTWTVYPTLTVTTTSYVPKKPKKRKRR